VQAGDGIDTRPAVTDKPRVRLRRRRPNPGDGGSEVAGKQGHFPRGGDYRTDISEQTCRTSSRYADGTLPQLRPPTGHGSTDSARKRLREDGTNDG
jgi:hypothetical protein